MHSSIPFPERRATRQVFDRAAATFDAADVVHAEARGRLLERLALVDLAPGWAVDLGCATGSASVALAERYPGARVLALDASTAMLVQARRRAGRSSRVVVLAGDAEHLPLASGSVDLLMANLLLPWCSLDETLREAARVLTNGGLLLFSTLGPDTLQEVRRAWASVDDKPHVHAFFDMHDVGDRVVAAGLAEPVLDVERLTLTYPDLQGLIADLRGCGAVNVAVGRRMSLTGKDRWRGFARAMGTPRDKEGRIAVTVELIFGQAWGRGRPAFLRSKGVEVAVPLERLRRHSRG